MGKGREVGRREEGRKKQIKMKNGRVEKEIKIALNCPQSSPILGISFSLTEFDLYRQRYIISNSMSNIHRF